MSKTPGGQAVSAVDLQNCKGKASGPIPYTDARIIDVAAKRQVCQAAAGG